MHIFLLASIPIKEQLLYFTVTIVQNAHKSFNSYKGTIVMKRCVNKMTLKDFASIPIKEQLLFNIIRLFKAIT